MKKQTQAISGDIYAAAKKCLDSKAYKEAEQHIFTILRKNIKDGAGLALLADLNVAQQKADAAVAYYIAAICADPAVQEYKEKFIQYSGSITVHQYEEINSQAILECLKSADQLDCSGLSVLWFQQLLLDPAFDVAFGLKRWKNFDTGNNTRFFEGAANFKPALTPYFLLGLKNIIVHSPVFEEFVTRLRHALLKDFNAHEKFSSDEITILAAALSHYSFSTDYILDVTEEERKTVDKLKDVIEGQGKGEAQLKASAVALLACYMPLQQLKNADHIVEDFAGHPQLFHVIKAQITEYRQLVETAGGVQSVAAITNAVSAKVQGQYEEFPYPRWKLLSSHLLRAQWESNPKNNFVMHHLRSKSAKILIAGCGTGQQAIMFATVFPDAEILAVDLSRNSLAYAIEKSRLYNIKNVTFRQADILNLDTIGQSFDLIVCVGVLHHMQDPAAGWKVLYRCLNPNGLMRIGLYSKLARQEVIHTQEIIQQEGYVCDQDSMKLFRQRSSSLLDRATLNALAAFADYYTLNEYRDLLFHAQERNYTLSEIEILLENIGLSFIDFATHLDVHPERRPDESVLASWHRFEIENPKTFRGMYIFWCKKSAQNDSLF